MLTENDIVENVARELENIGYTIESQLTTLDKGIDIVAKRGSKRLFIEAKGATSALETSRRFGKPFTKNQVRTHISVAFYTAAKTLQTFHEEDCLSCIALPDNPDHRMILAEIEKALRKLQIQLIWVAENGDVQLTELLK